MKEEKNSVTDSITHDVQDKMDLENETGDKLPLLDEGQMMDISEESINLVNEILPPAKNYPEGFPNLRIEIAGYVLTIECFKTLNVSEWLNDNIINCFLPCYAFKRKKRDFLLTILKLY